MGIETKIMLNNPMSQKNDAKSHMGTKISLNPTYFSFYRSFSKGEKVE